jgi:hypothetical protein
MSQTKPTRATREYRPRKPLSLRRATRRVRKCEGTRRSATEAPRGTRGRTRSSARRDAKRGFAGSTSRRRLAAERHRAPGLQRLARRPSASGLAVDGPYRLHRGAETCHGDAGGMAGREARVADPIRAAARAAPRAGYVERFRASKRSLSKVLRQARSRRASRWQHRRSGARRGPSTRAGDLVPRREDVRRPPAGSSPCRRR